MSDVLPLHPVQYRELLEAALAEDFGRGGDLTSLSVVPASARAEGLVVARESGTVAGLPLMADCFRLVDPAVEWRAEVEDGESVAAGTRLATVTGAARSLLGAERVGLNLLGHLSGIATATARYVAAIEGTGARIACTRKTTPGWRALEKYAVRCGGGSNHRFGLDDAVLIKDNHLVVADGVAEAVRRARSKVGHLVKIEVECDTLEQVEEAVAAGADVVLLDNMSAAQLQEAVARVGGRAVTEASGGITLVTARAVAESGVDLLSVGWITHSAPSLDVALDLVARP